MKKGMLKGQRRKLLFTVIFIMILTVSLNMIAFIWFQLRVYHMTFQQEFVDMKQKRILLYGDMENECEKHYSHTVRFIRVKWSKRVIFVKKG